MDSLTHAPTELPDAHSQQPHRYRVSRGRRGTPISAHRVPGTCSSTRRRFRGSNLDALTRR